MIYLRAVGDDNKRGSDPAHDFHSVPRTRLFSLPLVASRYLALMGCEGGEDFSLLASRHFGPVKGAPEHGRDLVKFRRRDFEVTMRILKAQWSASRFCWREFGWPARDLADPPCSHELEARQPAQVVPVPVP